MTIKDLAKLAGVSASTVSRVLNKNAPGAASPATRERISRLAAEHGYVPNSAARQLQKGMGSKALPLRFVCIMARASTSLDPFFGEIGGAIQRQCLQLESAVAGIYTAGDFLALEHAGDWDGAFVLGRYSATLMERLRTVCRYVVFVGLNPIREPYDQVVCDGYAAAAVAVEYLVSLGHKAIGYVGERSTEARYRGYFDTLKANRLQLSGQWILEAAQSPEGGRSAVRRLLAGSGPLPTALFCANDVTASGVLLALEEAGISVPDGMSVVGIDNIPLCETMKPPLTSVAIPKEELGEMAAKLMVDRAQGGHRLAVKVEIPFTLCRRQSCGGGSPIAIAKK